jgi:hypothetical protein
MVTTLTLVYGILLFTSTTINTVDHADATKFVDEAINQRRESILTLETSSHMPKWTLASIFQKLCQRRIPSCCLNVTDLNLLDDLSLTLGKIIQRSHKNKKRRFSLNPPSYRIEPLNCTHYTQQFFIRPLPRFWVKGKEPTTDVFSGHVLKKPRVLVDFIMVSYEIDLLEARLYEYHHLVDYFVIFESSYNHRGWRKVRFAQDALSDERFDPFRGKIRYYDIDTCDAYMKLVQMGRKNDTAQTAGKDVFDIQNQLRACRYSLTKSFLDELPDDALIIFTDLDWLPSSPLLHHIKRCEPSRHYGMANPFNLILGFDEVQSLQTSCKENRVTVPFALHSIQRIRQIKALPGRTGNIDKDLDRDKRRDYTIPFFYGGVHFMDIGNLAEVIYRDLTHAEVAGFREKLLLDNLPYCNVTDIFLEERQLRLSVYPQHVNWRLYSGRKEPNWNQVDYNVPGEPTAEHLESLRRCHIPWIFLNHRGSFPFLWGHGNYSMI